MIFPAHLTSQLDRSHVERLTLRESSLLLIQCCQMKHCRQCVVVFLTQGLARKIQSRHKNVSARLNLPVSKCNLPRRHIALSVFGVPLAVNTHEVARSPLS